MAAELTPNSNYPEDPRVRRMIAYECALIRGDNWRVIDTLTWYGLAPLVSGIVCCSSTEAALLMIAGIGGMLVIQGQQFDKGLDAITERVAEAPVNVTKPTLNYLWDSVVVPSTFYHAPTSVDHQIWIQTKRNLLQSVNPKVSIPENKALDKVTSVLKNNFGNISHKMFLLGSCGCLMATMYFRHLEKQGAQRRLERYLHVSCMPLTSFVEDNTMPYLEAPFHESIEDGNKANKSSWMKAVYDFLFYDGTTAVQNLLKN